MDFLAHVAYGPICHEIYSHVPFPSFSYAYWNCCYAISQEYAWCISSHLNIKNGECFFKMMPKWKGARKPQSGTQQLDVPHSEAPLHLSALRPWVVSRNNIVFVAVHC